MSTSVSIVQAIIKTGDDCISAGRGASYLWIEHMFRGPGHGISFVEASALLQAPSIGCHLSSLSLSLSAKSPSQRPTSLRPCTSVLSRSASALGTQLPSSGLRTRPLHSAPSCPLSAPALGLCTRHPAALLRPPHSASTLGTQLPSSGLRTRPLYSAPSCPLSASALGLYTWHPAALLRPPHSASVLGTQLPSLGLRTRPLYSAPSCPPISLATRPAPVGRERHVGLSARPPEAADRISCEHHVGLSARPPEAADRISCELPRSPSSSPAGPSSPRPQLPTSAPDLGSSLPQSPDGDAKKGPSEGSGTPTPTNSIPWGADHQ